MGKPELDPFAETSEKYEMNLIYLLDTSGSMNGARIDQLNIAMAEAVQIAEETALSKEVKLYMRVAEFNTTARWIFGDRNNGVEHIEWTPLKAHGSTDTSGAIELARGVMSREYLGVRNYKPVVILITDGESNEPQKTRDAAARLKATLRSGKAVEKDKILRIGIGVKGANRAELEGFASVGTIIRDENNVEENVPLVLDVDQIDLLRNLLRGVTVSSIVSSIRSGEDGTDEKQDIIDVTEPEPDWEI